MQYVMWAAGRRRVDYALQQPRFLCLASEVAGYAHIRIYANVSVWRMFYEILNAPSQTKQHQ